MPPSRLIVTPTELERNRLRDAGARWDEIHVIGFGLVESAAGMAELLASSRSHATPVTLGDASPSVMLCGIAGTFDPRRFGVGQAIRVDQVRIDGIGIGNRLDGEFQSAASLGWHRDAPLRIDATSGGGGLTALSVAAAASGPREAADRRVRYPDAAIEDMETYSIAAICHAYRVDLTVIRGISNVVGDRRPEHWKIDQACQSIVATAAAMSLG